MVVTILMDARGLCVVAVSVAAVAGGLTGCGSEAEPVETPLFSGMSDSCAKLAAPAMDAIRQSTGNLFSADVAFEDEGNQPASEPGQSVKVCGALYLASPIHVGTHLMNAAERRFITLTFSLHSDDDAVASAKHQFGFVRDQVKGRTTSGLGDESLEGANGSVKVTRAITAFRKSNAVVDVAVSGLDSSGKDVEVSELEPGSRSIARALADNIGAAFNLE
ncbi:hypothetical protein ACFQZZ_25350 [Nocardia sp. GCM10030253]|uniref:hypothetical protein n=1 Tax=Nocardia sp. GCM10030253 TaxID=3273404 RepID=UPI003639C1D7